MPTTWQWTVSTVQNKIEMQDFSISYLIFLAVWLAWVLLIIKIWILKLVKIVINW